MAAGVRGAGLSQMERTVLAEELAAVGVPNGAPTTTFFPLA